MKYTGSEPSSYRGAGISKRSSKKQSPSAFSQAVGRALRRAAKATRKTPDARHADLRVGKREGCGEEALKSVNNYLTTPGSPAPEVWGMIEDLGFKIEVDYQTAAEKGPQLRSQSLEPLNVQH